MSKKYLQKEVAAMFGVQSATIARWLKKGWLKDLTQESIDEFTEQYKSKEDKSRVRKVWTLENVSFLKENWGVLSLEALARNVGTTEGGIESKAEKLGLSGYLAANPLYYTVTMLVDGLGCSQSRIYKLIRDNDIPYVEKKKSLKNNKKYYLFKTTDFWKYVERNPDKIPLGGLRADILLEAPDWAIERAKTDGRFNEDKKWTLEETVRLANYYSMQNLGVKDIMIRLNRTEYSVRQKARRLCLAKGDGHIWSAEEIKNRIRTIERKKRGEVI